ncbi:MAG: fatty acid desaturase, partial [Paucibacter sp.]|nr:fatty acid desaturase [Roseateles sp.]
MKAAAIHGELRKRPFAGRATAPVFVDLAIYRGYHMTHHVKTGTAQDPDLGNYANYPVSRASLLRKFGRDLTGRSGLRALL